jgi:hypothetical protein
MSSFPCLVRSVSASGEARYALGDPFVDRPFLNGALTRASSPRSPPQNARPSSRARILAGLLAADFLPDTWVADDRARIARRLVVRRTHLVSSAAG